MRFRYSLICRGVGWITLLIMNGSMAAAPANDVVRAQVGFNSTISDEEVGSVLTKSSVNPSAVFMWSAGLTGTHRPRLCWYHPRRADSKRAPASSDAI
jgi:hypothetical protein